MTSAKPPKPPCAIPQISSCDTSQPSTSPHVRIENMIKKYSQGLDERLIASNPLPTTHCVLLTGSTGNLGSQILDRLLRDPTVERIYVLNRPSSKSSMAKHKERFEDKGLDFQLLGLEKLTFLEGDTSSVNLGIPILLYMEIQSRVTTIIHTAWRLNFNLPLPSFESNIHGARRLIDLARGSPYGACVRFIFTSSTSLAFSWDTDKGRYPEEILTDARYAVGMGYGESKYVTERIITSSGLRATSLRIGQLCGDVPNGAWATSNWVPMAVKSSIALGALPAEAGPIGWIPMDLAAQAILDIAFTSSHEPNPALNILHPQPITFHKMMVHVNEALVCAGVIRAPLQIISQPEWTALLEARASSAPATDLNQLPAVKILDFFRTSASVDADVRSGRLSGIDNTGLPLFSTAKAQVVSKTLATLLPIGAHHAHSWIAYWRASGLFDHNDTIDSSSERAPFTQHKL